MVVVVLAMTGGHGEAPTADGVGEVPAGPELARVLAGLTGRAALSRPEDAGSVDDAGLLDVAAGWQRLIGWALAGQAAVGAELASRRAWSVEHTAAAAELGAHLRVPDGEANRLMARGAGLAAHPEVAEALVTGRLDVVKADLLLFAGTTLTVEQRAAAIAEVLPGAADRSRGWVRDQMNDHARRHLTVVEQARTDREGRAVYLDPVDGATMAWLSAHLPATDAAAVWQSVDSAARALKRAAGSTRTLAQARADALTAILTGRLVVPEQPACTPTTTTTTTTATTATATATTTTATATIDATAIDVGASAAATDLPATGGTVTVPATGTDLPAAGGTATATAGPRAGRYVPGVPRTTAAAGSGCVCGGCLCGATRITVLPVRAQVKVTIAATTLAGGDDHPGHLDGYGPIAADTAARLATDGTWQRLVTDPRTGILTDHSTHTYTPGAVLRAAVVDRDRTCCFPQCDRPATGADLDHITAFDHTLDPARLPAGTPGQTRAGNLQPLCRRHHNAKTHHGWTAHRHPDTGHTVWTAPTGNTYLRPATTIGRPVPTSTGTQNDTGATDVTSLHDHTRRLLGHPPADHPTADTAPSQPTCPEPGAPPF